MPGLQRGDARAAARHVGDQRPRPLAHLTISLPITDGTVTLRATGDGDATRLIAGRDAEFRRWLGAGSPDPRPTAVIEVDDELAGWVDHDAEPRAWLAPDQCNVGYYVFAPFRRRGNATRAVRLLLELLRDDASFVEATFLVDAENEASLRVARAVGATERGRFPNADGRPQVLLGVELSGPVSS